MIVPRCGDEIALFFYNARHGSCIIKSEQSVLARRVAGPRRMIDYEL